MHFSTPSHLFQVFDSSVPHSDILLPSRPSSLCHVLQFRSSLWLLHTLPSFPPGINPQQSTVLCCSQVRPPAAHSVPSPSLPILSPWSPQIGQWHVAEGLSMDSRLYASNISDSLFNTTLVVTTILVSGVSRASSCSSRGCLLPRLLLSGFPGNRRWEC